MTFKLPDALLILVILIFPAATLAESPYTDPTTGMELGLIKGDCFDMGDSIGEGDPNERPVREVCVSDFYMGKYEVTNAQYKRFRPGHDSGTSEGMSLDKDGMPVVNVSWDDAMAFAAWLSQESGKIYRLPTEAEWEYAARSGSEMNHFWGNSPDRACEYANVADMSAKELRPKWTTFFCDDGYATVAPVGSFKPNEFGLYDMLGNVWEWCRDVYNSEAYIKLPSMDPLFAGRGEYRVMRGGGWSNGPLGIRSSHRVGLSPNFGHHSLGIRLVMEAD